MATTQLGTEKVFGFVLPAGANGQLVKQTVIAFLMAGFLLSLFVFFILPRFSELAIETKKVKDLEMKSENLTKSLDALDGFRQNVSGLARESVYLAVPTKFDPGYILLSLRKLASENQVNLVTYSLAGGELKEAVEKKSVAGAISHLVEVEISGTPLNLINFVDNLDYYLPIVSVAELSISEVSQVITSGTNDAKLTMSLNFYHMPLSLASSDLLTGKLLTQKDIDTINSLIKYKRLGSSSSSVGVPAGSGNENIFGF
ncbi:hypothetical protein HYU90_03325 [Candidatus Collierbacteria bacterium]|nr:hypothetical protein [Candidatus Collierbacteria bacterium]